MNPLDFIPCGGLPSCGAGAGNVLLSFTIPTIVSFLLQLAASLALVYVIYSGIQMLFSQGDESKIDKARNGILYALLGLGGAIFSGVAVTLVVSQVFVGGGSDILFGPTGLIANGIGIVMQVFNVTFAIVAVLGGMRMVTARGRSDEFNKGIMTIVYAIAGAVVVNLARAIVQAFLLLYL